MRRTALLVPVLLLSLAPAASAQEAGCGGSAQYVPTLSLSLPTAPGTVRAGSRMTIPVTVTRAGSPAIDVAVSLQLRQKSSPKNVTYATARTGGDGRAALTADVPRRARGPLQVTVQGFRPVIEVPCYGSGEEYGTAAGSWGSAVR